MTRRFAFALGVVMVLLVGCASGAQDVADPASVPDSSPAATAAEASASAAADMSIAEVLRADGRFSRLLDIAERTRPTSFAGVWENPGDQMGDNQDGVTVFAPTDAAFEALAPEVAAALDDPDVVTGTMLYALVSHHYVHRLYPSEEFEEGPQDTWRTSGNVELGTDPLTWGGNAVIETDIRAENGYVHVVDGVVIPDNLSEAVEAETQ